MIGVIANPTEHVVVLEFFELFKTPWEFYKPGCKYDVVVSSGIADMPECDAKLILLYFGSYNSLDISNGAEVKCQFAKSLSHRRVDIPIYRGCVTFRDRSCPNSRHSSTAIYHFGSAGGRIVRIGYDLFGEIRDLLTVGQPVENASVPALDLHIDLLRDLIISAGIPLIEIPPVPRGYRFLACLTHDVDHPSLRQHKCDHTMFGFLYRATLGSLLKLIRGRMNLSDLLSNLAAALKLPLVHLGLASDVWLRFDHYTRLENGLASTFFVIPFKDRRGHVHGGEAPNGRASRYGIADISAQVRSLISAGCAIETHGIDAWMDSSEGRSEIAEVRRIAGPQVSGIRMHWLYFDERTPVILEEAGADHDSTSGYNETIGYRAGTTQAYKPLEAVRLLELPLHLMDTAMFYPDYLDLSLAEAHQRVDCIIENAVRLGGCVTVNWHDRSIAPERLWGRFYLEIVDKLRANEAWFATTGQAVSWFRKRRSAVFEAPIWEGGELRATIRVEQSDDLPDLEVRVYNGSESVSSASSN